MLTNCNQTARRRFRTGLVRGDLLPLLILLFGVAFSVWGLAGIRMDNENVLRWLPDNSTARDDYEFFRKHFSSDDYVVVSWPGCTVNDQRLQRFCDLIREQVQPDLIHSVTSGRDVLLQMSATGGLSPPQIQQRLAGVFFGTGDRELTCAVIALGQGGRARRAEAMALISRMVEQTDGLNPDDMMIAGYPWLAVVMNRMIEETFRNLLPVSGAAATLVALLCLRNFLLAMIGLVAAGIAAGFSVALIPACGGKIGGLTMVIPTLAFVLTMSGALHLTRYALNSPGDLQKLLRVGWLPCTVSTLTTIIGVLTLTSSNYPAVREFGAYSAGSLVFSLVIQLGLLPWMITRWGQPGLLKLVAGESADRFWKRFPGRIETLRIPVALLTVAALGFSVFGLYRIQPNVEAENVFASDSGPLVSIRQLEKQIGPMDQTEALLVFENPPGEDFYRRAAYVRQIAALFSRIPEVGRACALTDYLPAEPTGSGIAGNAKKRIWRQELAENRMAMEQSDLLRVTAEGEIWRISLKFPFVEPTDFVQLESRVRRVSDRFGETARSRWTGFVPPRLVYTGTTHLVHDAQHLLLYDFAFSFLMAFVMITPVLMLVLRSVGLGAIGMLGNLIPAVVVFGMLGWLQIPVDVALGMTASVALGIAVDDTTHLMIRFREYGGTVRTARPALQRALMQCGPAMLQTTLIACAGIGTFYFSELLVISRFAATISVLLVTAVVADLFVLPVTLLLCENATAQKT